MIPQALETIRRVVFVLELAVLVLGQLCEMCLEMQQRYIVACILIGAGKDVWSRVGLPLPWSSADLALSRTPGLIC